MFSLYADRAEQMPLLAEMINKSGMNAKEFIKTKVIGPFVKQWMEMVLVHGISMEPHAQNVLIGLNSKNLPNEKFMHRDFGGFNLDLESFKRLQTMSPAKLPTATTVVEDYHQKHVGSSVNQGLETYFDQGFVFNLDQKLPEWVRNGWIIEYRKLDSLGRANEKGLFSKMIYETMTEEFARLTKNQAQPGLMDLKNDNIHEWVKYAREFLKAPKKISCEGVLL